MPVKKDATGRRYVEAEAEVPGTPEEVWHAIATGPGISSWFVPTEVTFGEGGVPETVVSHFGPGSSMDSVATITSWEPPHRFTADSPAEPSSPAVATEWIVEAKSGGTCTVRVVHSWFADSDDWDNQFEGHEQGWVAFFRILRLYLDNFRGQASAMFQAMPFTSMSVPQAWETAMAAFDRSPISAGQRVESVAGAPRLAGIVERAGAGDYPELLLRLTEPAPGIAHFFAMQLGRTVCVPVRLYLFGNDAGEVVAREEPRWQAFLNERFAAGGMRSEV